MRKDEPRTCEFVDLKDIWNGLARASAMIWPCFEKE